MASASEKRVVLLKGVVLGIGVVLGATSFLFGMWLTLMGVSAPVGLALVAIGALLAAGSGAAASFIYDGLEVPRQTSSEFSDDHGTERAPSVLQKSFMKGFVAVLLPAAILGLATGTLGLMATSVTTAVISFGLMLGSVFFAGLSILGVRIAFSGKQAEDSDARQDDAKKKPVIGSNPVAERGNHKPLFKTEPGRTVPDSSDTLPEIQGTACHSKMPTA